MAGQRVKAAGRQGPRSRRRGLLASRWGKNLPGELSGSQLRPSAGVSATEPPGREGLAASLLSCAASRAPRPPHAVPLRTHRAPRPQRRTWLCTRRRHLQTKPAPQSRDLWHDPFRASSLRQQSSSLRNCRSPRVSFSKTRKQTSCAEETRNLLRPGVPRTSFRNTLTCRQATRPVRPAPPGTRACGARVKAPVPEDTTAGRPGTPVVTPGTGQRSRDRPSSASWRKQPRVTLSLRVTEPQEAGLHDGGSAEGQLQKKPQGSRRRGWQRRGSSPPAAS